MSIATKRVDGGQTTPAGGTRVSKGPLRVEAYGTIDERPLCAMQRTKGTFGLALVSAAPGSPGKHAP